MLTRKPEPKELPVEAPKETPTPTPTPHAKPDRVTLSGGPESGDTVSGKGWKEGSTKVLAGQQYRRVGDLAYHEGKVD